MTKLCDIAIVGAGMAGASLGATLAPHASVVVLEAEEQPGYHATGRSAAFWTESYGGPQIQPLTTASGPALKQGGFLTPRGALTIAQNSQAAELNAFIDRFSAQGVRMEKIEGHALSDRLPGLLPEWTLAALEPDCCDIDVAALHRHYLARLTQAGGRLLCGTALVAAERRTDGWHLTLGQGRTLSAKLLINAAGAWADSVAQLAGARALGITPLRRTMAQLRMASPVSADLPLVIDLAEQFYFKPESGRLWLSPHDETPSAPCDAAPDEIDVALAIDRLSGVVNWQVERVEHRWAGLRSFAPDRLPVYGFDRQDPGLFWFAGQGGFGIQTAPAAAELAAALILVKSGGAIDPAPFSPARFN